MSAKAKMGATPLAQATMNRFLDAAEDVFGEHGYEGATIRAIATKSGVNLGALQHYWGSKQALFHDLFERRFRPLHEEHLRRLRDIEAALPAGAAPSPEAVLRTLIDHTFGAEQGERSDSLDSEDRCRKTSQSDKRRSLRRLYGRALLDPSPYVVAEMNHLFKDSINLYIELMRRACPDVPKLEFDWRLHCITGAHLFALVHSERMGSFFEESDDGASRAADWMLHFLMGGVLARPFAEPPEPPKTNPPPKRRRRN